MKPRNRIGSPSIFIIDDSITDCQWMSNSLQRAGCKVDFATDGRKGLTNVMENPPQCLILSVILPGISGYAICRQVRAVEQYGNIPIIIIGTKNTPLDQKYSLKMGANCYLVKPFSEEVLLQTVKKILPGLPFAAMAHMLSPLVPQSDIPGVSTSQEEYTLIPCHPNEADIMLRRNPFANSVIMSDRHLHRLYAAIDGHRNIQELAETTQLDLQSTVKLLKTLWQEQNIVFYDKKRRILKEISLFNSRT